jgi:hypothetical protein
VAERITAVVSPTDKTMGETTGGTTERAANREVPVM